jgi:hypothetical protein
MKRNVIPRVAIAIAIVYLKFSKVPARKVEEQLKNWLKAKFNKNVKAIFAK